MKEQKKNKQRGITLIALVVSIIVLIILAGVSIAMLVGENGIITQAQRADELTTQAQQKEAIELAIASVQVQGTLELDKTKLETALQSQLGDTEYGLTENRDGSFLLQIAERSYYINSTGEVITEENMISIGTAEELKAFRDEVNSGNTYEGKYVYLTGDITLNSSEQWEPIGFYSQDTESVRKVLENEKNKPFSGIFDGKGYTIDNAYINTSDSCQGIFGLVVDGEIKNINLGENNVLSMSGSTSGGLVGYMYRTGKIVNCNNYADMEQTYGGIVGFIAGSITISNCINYGDLNNANGGIVGNSNGTDWEEFADVSHTIINCGNYGNITKASSNYLGGIVGSFKGDILNCFNKADITMNSANSAVGGIAGSIVGLISNCYSIGNVSSQSYSIGGICGQGTAKILNCYSIGTITGTFWVGNILGNTTASVIDNCYSQNDTFTYTDLGDSFKEDDNNINNGYPILQWQ